MNEHAKPSKTQVSLISIKKPRIIIILPAQLFLLLLRPLRLPQHFHARLAQLLLHALRHLRPHLVGEIGETRRPVLLHSRNGAAR